MALQIKPSSTQFSACPGSAQSIPAGAVPHSELRMQTLFVSLLTVVASQTLTTTPADGTSSFITTLGRDTVVVESRPARATTSPAMWSSASPLPYAYTTTFELRADGSVARSTLDTDPMGAKNIPAATSSSTSPPIPCRPASIPQGKSAKSARALPKGTVPMFMTGFGPLYGLYSSMGTLRAPPPAHQASRERYARRHGHRYRHRRDPEAKVLARSATQIDVDYFGILWTHLTVDATGSITAADARATTEQTETHRVAFVDVVGDGEVVRVGGSSREGRRSPRRRISSRRDRLVGSR